MSEAASGADSAKILMVDDNSRNLQLLARILQPAGYRLMAAQDGTQALTAARKGEPALILLDVMMPGIDGFEVCRRLKADARTRETPVIFLTARTETADIVRGFELGAVDYIVKPFVAVELLTRVRTHLDAVRRGRLQGVWEMAGAVCHELHQPMQGVLGLMDMMRREMDGSPGCKAVLDRMAALEKEVDRMREITDKLTRITRYETRDYLSGRIVDLDRAVGGDDEPSGRGETE